MIEERTKQVVLKFKREELLYDCKNYAYVEGDVMKTDDDHDRHQVQDIAEDGNVDRLTRVFDLAIAECVEFCYPYSKVAVGDHTEMDDVLENTEEYVVNLLVPDDFSQTTVNLLEKYIHEFLVCRALGDWFTITYPDKSAVWLAKAEDAEEQITDTLNHRVKRVRRPLNPF